MPLPLANRRTSLQCPSEPLATLPSTTNACKDLVRTFPLRDSPLGRKRTPRSSQQQASQSQGQPQGSHIRAPEWAKSLLVGSGHCTNVGRQASTGLRRLLRYLLYLPDCACYRAVVSAV